MTNHHKLSTVLLGILVSCTVLAQSRPSGGLTETGKLIILIQDVFDVSPKAGPDLISSVKSAQDAFENGKISDINQAIDNVVEVVNAGATPAATNERLLPRVHINSYASYSNSEDPAFAESVKLNNLRTLIHRKGIAAKDPAAKRKLLRAAILLSADEDFMFGRAFLRNLNVTQLSRDIGLNEVQRDRLVDAIRQTKDNGEKFNDAMPVGLFGRDRILEVPHKQSVPDDLIKSVSVYFDLAWQRSKGELDNKFIVIQETWTLRNIGVAKHQPEVVNAAENLLKSWEKTTQDNETVMRWLQEARLTTAPAPDKPTVVGFKGENDPNYKRLLAKLAHQP